MKNTKARKSFIKRIKENKVAVGIIVFLAVGALVFSSLISVFMNNPGSPNESASDYYEEQIKLLEGRIGGYEENLQSSPENEYLLTQLGDSYYDLAIIYSYTGNQEKSVAFFEKATEPYGKVLERSPEELDVRVNRAMAAYMSYNYDLADQEFKTAIETDPTNTQAHFNYGIFLYLALDKPEDAIVQWEEVVALNPQDEAELVELAQSWIAAAQEELDQTHEDVEP